MKTLEEQFRSRVGTFLGRSGLSPTAFGKKALGDPNLMRQIDRHAASFPCAGQPPLVALAGAQVDLVGLGSPRGSMIPTLQTTGQPVWVPLVGQIGQLLADKAQYV